MISPMRAATRVPRDVILSRREFIAASAAALGSALYARPAGAAETIAIKHAENPNGADLDIVDASGNPMFRVLLPESVTAANFDEPVSGTHTITGDWRDLDGTHFGRVPCSEWAEIRIALHPLEQGVLVLFGVRNLTDEDLIDVDVDICVSVSHLPCSSGDWINPDFLQIPSPPERGVAGRFWYERVAPSHVKALCAGQWTPAHAHPDTPSSEGVPSYQPFVFLDESASVIAAESLDGRHRLFMAWDVPCRAQCVFPGNSCMHLHPRIADRVPVGQTVFARGEIALTPGSWEQIANWNVATRRDEYDAMEQVLAGDAFLIDT